MRTSRASIAGLLIIMLAATGCCGFGKEDGIFTITLKAHLDDDGMPTFVMEHDDVAVFPGERVRWVCDCPGIDSFAVRNVQHLASIDELVDLYLSIEERGGIEAMRDTASRFREAADVEGEAAAAVRAEATVPLLEGYDRMLTLLAATVELAPSGAFETPTPPDFVPTADAIESAPYRKIDGNHIWKFTWVLKHGDHVVHWDPHFSGHRKRDQ